MISIYNSDLLELIASLAVKAQPVLVELPEAGSVADSE